MARMKSHGTYVYCLIASARRPPASRLPRGLKGTGPVRLLDAGAGPNRMRRWLAVADASLERYGEEAIREGLRDLEWVASAAVAHERVVEAFLRLPAVVPMKLFTIFSSDERAVEHIGSERTKIDELLARLSHRDEWGVRLTLADRPRPAAPPRRRVESGADYLARKKGLRDASAERLERSAAVAAELYDRLASRSDASRRRSVPEAGGRGRLLLDAVFLVRRAKAGSFSSRAGREARELASRGFHLTLTGPWPAYSFVGD